VVVNMINRELKFRVWDTATKKMLSGFHLFGETTLIGGIHVWQQQEGEAIGIKRSNISALADLIIMQYTGLEDKNGKEIYEGDIVQRGVVLFSNGKFQGYYYESNGGIAESWEDDLYKEKDIEVLGNIYENPELMRDDN